MPKLSPDAPLLHEGCTITDSSFGRYVEIGQCSRIGYSEIGDYSYCDRFADIANTSVGKFCNIASFVRIGPTDHPMERASLHHFAYRTSYYWDEPDDAAFFARRRARRTVIGHDTWIGHGAVIRPDVTVGHGAVVAAGAVVTRDVPPYTIVTGIPARPMRSRYAGGLAERMIALAWWDWPHDRLHAALPDFRALTAAEFLAKHEG